MSHGSVARSVRANKESHPENYCKAPNCLWRTATRDGVKPCPKHQQWTPASARQQVGGTFGT